MLLSRSPSGPKKFFPIPVAHLEDEIRARSADDCKRFREEFNVSLGPLFVVWKGAGMWGVVLHDKLPQRRRTLTSAMAQPPKRGSEETRFLPQCPPLTLIPIDKVRWLMGSFRASFQVTHPEH